MPSEQDGVMIILSSPSGAGKTTLVKMLSKLDNFEISISHTTRKPRHNEFPDEDYFFVNEKEFKRFIKNEEFLEYAKVFNNFYGTTRTPVIDKLNKGKNADGWEDFRLNKKREVRGISGKRFKEVKKDLRNFRYDEIVEDHLYRTLIGQEIWLKLGFPYIVDKKLD